MLVYVCVIETPSEGEGDYQGEEFAGEEPGQPGKPPLALPSIFILCLYAYALVTKIALFPLVSGLLSALRHYSDRTTRKGAAISNSTYLPQGSRQGASHPALFAKPLWFYSSKHYGGRHRKGKEFPKISLRK